MKYYQWILLILAIILMLYVHFQIDAKRRIALYGVWDKKEGFSVPGFGNTEEGEVKKLKSSLPINIANLSKNFTNESLKQYIIKGSYNCAVTGNYVNSNAIRNVLERGCRFLDFEVLYIDSKPMVSYTLDKEYEMIETDNTLLLDDAFAAAISTGFSQKSPNPNDPLFIHLRVKSKDKSIYKAIGKSVDFVLKDYLYSEQVTGETQIKDIMRKVVLVLDNRIDKNYKDFSVCEASDHTCYDVSDYVNINSGTTTLSINQYSEVLNEQSMNLTQGDECDYCTNVEKYRMAVPNTMQRTSNPELKELFVDHGIQIVPLQFYQADEYLEQYEEFFNEHKSAFVPLSHAISYYTKRTL